MHAVFIVEICPHEIGDIDPQRDTYWPAGSQFDCRCVCLLITLTPVPVEI